MATFGTTTYYRDSLAEINAAVTAITVKGQRYRIADRELWRPDLEWLMQERKRLEPLAAKEGRGGRVVRQVVPL